MGSFSFQKVTSMIVVFLLFASLSVFLSNNAKAWDGIEEMDIPYKSVVTDPYGDVKNCTSEETIENNETVERPNIDLKEIYVRYNESTLFIMINVWGEIEVSPWVGYSLSFESNVSLPTPIFIFRNIWYKNGTATFEGEENKSIKCYSINSSLILEVPIVYLYDEGCIQNNSLHILSGSACELVAEKIDDEWKIKYFYDDSFDSCYYFFLLGAKIISVTPNSAVIGEPVQFIGVGGDPYETVTYEWWSSIDGFLSNNTSFTTSDLSLGNHTIYFRVRNTTATIEKTKNIPVREEWVFPSPDIFINISITPNPAVEGETVYFTGSCNLSCELNYEWKSSIDGLLSNKSSFSTNNLSVGTHTITFSVWEGSAYFIVAWKYASTSTALTVLPQSEEKKNDMLLERVEILIGICILISILCTLLVIKRKSGGKRKHKLFTLKTPLNIYARFQRNKPKADAEDDEAARRIR